MTDKPWAHIVVHPDTGERLCNDNKWRGFAMFGSCRSAVKEYKYQKAAMKAAQRYSPKGRAHVVHMYKGDTMDASGNVKRCW